MPLLNDEFIPQREDAMHHANEDDIMRAATLYLIHPINQALCASPALAGMVKCQSEPTTHKTRSHIMFYRNRVAPSGPPRAFAVVEFKRRGVIRHQEFQAADKDITAKTPITYHVQVVYKIMRESASFFCGNSLVLISKPPPMPSGITLDMGHSSIGISLSSLGSNVSILHLIPIP